MKICKDGRVWGQNNKIAGSHLGILTRQKPYSKEGSAFKRKRGEGKREKQGLIKGNKIGKTPSSYFILKACEVCGLERWVSWNFKEKKPRGKLCRKCSAVISASSRSYNKSSSWKGGRITSAGGYIKIKLRPDDFFYSMADKTAHYVFEHRLVVAKALGRCLHLWEIVHHKEGCAKDDNRYPETLQLVTDDRHKQISILERRIARLEDKVEEQIKLIKLLQWQNKEIHRERIKK